jgi:hypothetical protein
LEKAQFVIHFILKILYFIPSICLFAQQFGRLPIELAAEYGTWEDVELLFPVTSKIPTVADWSVNGVISHVYMEVMQLEVCHQQDHASSTVMCTFIPYTIMVITLHT